MSVLFLENWYLFPSKTLPVSRKQTYSLEGLFTFEEIFRNNNECEK
jgi:hypothetical protein